MGTFFLGVLVAGNVVLLCLGLGIFWRLKNSSQVSEIRGLREQYSKVHESLSQRFNTATADMAMRLEQTKGDLRQEVTDRLGEGFQRIGCAVEDQLSSGRREQAQDMREARAELTNSLAMTTAQLKQEFDGLNQTTAQSLEGIRQQVDQKLMAITDQVQQHLKAAEEQLREVGALGDSINDLNNLLKLPHLRGRFGEASLERLLADFLPAHMFEMQAQLPEGRGRADAI